MCPTNWTAGSLYISALAMELAAAGFGVPGLLRTVELRRPQPPLGLSGVSAGVATVTATMSGGTAGPGWIGTAMRTLVERDEKGPLATLRALWAANKWGSAAAAAGAAGVVLGGLGNLFGVGVL